ncbi:MAG: hypothetical protein JXQ75_02185 [Phycisphaerae bacterium]|nr:hypothetical protein [Phycisphaerae bacterium]
MLMSALPRTVVAIVFVGAVLGGARSVAAQDELQFPIVTAVSADSAATWTRDGGKPQPLAHSRTLDGERLRVADNQQIMVYSPSGEAALVILGPAELAVQVLNDRINVEFVHGWLIAIGNVPQDRQKVHFSAPGAPQAEPLVAGFIGDGWTILSREDSRVNVGYQARPGAAASMTMTVGGRSESVPTGQRLSVVDGNVEFAPIEPWLAENQPDYRDVGQKVGVESAKITRLRVQGELIEDLILWDRRAQAKMVIPGLTGASPFKPEIRQVFSVTTQVQATQNRGAAAQVPTVPGANEVPLLSPAAISVGGVTAILLNRNAAGLVQSSRSRGLGFNGLSQLALPGMLNGTRNLGPPGLSATGQ